MKRALVMSDSHRSQEELRRLLEMAWQRCGKEKIDAYIHLGDGTEDFEALESMMFYRDPRSQFHRVRGNCDFSAVDVPDEDVFELGGANLFACHGHRYHVKSTLMYLDYAARERGCTIALFGHTHVQCVETGNGVTLINPGSARDGCMGLLQIEDGVPDFIPLRF